MGAIFCNWKWIKWFSWLFFFFYFFFTGTIVSIDLAPRIILQAFTGADAIAPVSWQALTCYVGTAVTVFPPEKKSWGDNNGKTWDSWASSGWSG
jgi:hypothetical protein